MLYVCPGGAVTQLPLFRGLWEEPQEQSAEGRVQTGKPSLHGLPHKPWLCRPLVPGRQSLESIDNGWGHPSCKDTEECNGKTFLEKNSSETTMVMDRP